MGQNGRESLSRRAEDGKASASAFARWPWWRRWFGLRSERFAARFLRRQGFRILAHNVLTHPGELDLIALDRGTLVIVEVRSTEGPDPLSAAESIGPAKVKALTDAALRFLAGRRLLDVPVRFDVLAIAWPPGREPVVRHYPHAFEAVGRFQMYR